ncbi:MAG: GAF domain-containing protein [Deltaproteobacteria bacterium]|nr:GAF domain-containing protein [Deltaproteobacteria bacterium]
MGVATHSESRERLVEALHSIMEESKEILDCGASSLFLYDEDRNDLYFEVVVGGDEAVRAYRVPLGQGIAGMAAERRETLIVNDAPTDSRHLKLQGTDYVTRNLVATPMLRKGRLIGVLEVLNRHTGEFDALDAKILEVMAEQAAVLIENTHLIRDKIQAERLAALGNVAAGLAHHINNILSQWQGSAWLIEHGLEQDDLEAVAGAWPLMKRANDRITRLVLDMLSIAKARRPERSRVDLNAVVAQVVEGESERAARIGATLDPDLDDTVPAALLDPGLIYEIVTNLVSNALDAVDDPDVANRRVRVRTRWDADRETLVLEVTDNGPGIPPHLRDRVFEPFFSTKGKRGTGLGLAQVSKTADEHGGRIQVLSVPGGGATFQVCLPYLDPDSTSST